MIKQGNNWSLEYDNTVLIARFEAGTDFDKDGEDAFHAFQEILRAHGDDIVGSANLIEVEDAISQEVYDIWEAAAKEYAQLPNYERGAVVANGIKKFSLKRSLDVPGATNDMFDDFDRAIEWVRHG